jgi:hypothetical protein
MPERNTTGEVIKIKRMDRPVSPNAKKTDPVSPAIKCTKCNKIMLRLGKITLCTNEYCGYIDAK